MYTSLDRRIVQSRVTINRHPPTRFPAARELFEVRLYPVRRNTHRYEVVWTETFREALREAYHMTRALE